MICYTKKRKKKHDKWKSKVDAETITKEVKEKIKEKATHKPRKKYNDTTIQLDNEHTMSITPHVLGTGLIFCKIWSTKHYLAKRDVMKYEKEIRETALRELPNSQCPVLMRELIKHGNIKICKRSALHFGEKWVLNPGVTLWIEMPLRSGSA